jgi:DNA-binding GntR family transcriptional regulator
VSSGEESERPYLRIAAAIRHRITTGALRPGDRVPSTRRVVRDFGVATAIRALAVLRDEGLVLTRVGSGTVVRASATGTPGGSSTWSTVTSTNDWRSSPVGNMA